jgi:hypothetical protein
VHALGGGKLQMIFCVTTSDGPTAMSPKTCRDCGNVLEREARGCPRCAMNLEAENMIDRFIWRRVVPGLFLVVVLTAAAFLYYLR